MNQPAPVQTCANCGETRGKTDVFCVMSRDGEGPHDWVSAERLTLADLRELQGISGYEADPGDQ